MPNFTVPEYQAMMASGQVISGVVDLYPPISADQLPLEDGVTYIRRDGYETTIQGAAKNGDGSESTRYVWALSGTHYERATGNVRGYEGPSFSSISSRKP